MTTAVLASSAADSQAGEAIRAHHAQLSGALQAGAANVLAKAERGLRGDTLQAAAELAAWCERELAPHAAAEEAVLYAAARDREATRLLVAAMTDEHGVLLGLIRSLTTARTAVEAAATARALQTVFLSHLGKENDRLLPILEAASDVDLAGLLEGMHHELAGGAHDASHDAHAEHGHGAAASAPAAHSCNCGHADEDGYPVLDARAIPHAIRHATIFGALATVPSGGGLVLVAPHDPLPLLAQIEQAYPGGFEVDYLERGPESWQLAFVRAN